MTDISQIRAQRHREAEAKQRDLELRKTRTEYLKKYRKEVKRYESLFNDMQKIQENKKVRLETELERKLADMRNRHKRAVEEEKRRLSEEIKDLKKAHQEQVAEVKVSQESELNHLRETHEDSLHNAKNKYLREKVKWESTS